MTQKNPPHGPGKGNWENTARRALISLAAVALAFQLYYCRRTVSPRTEEAARSRLDEMVAELVVMSHRMPNTRRRRDDKVRAHFKAYRSGQGDAYCPTPVQAAAGLSMAAISAGVSNTSRAPAFIVSVV